MTDLVPDPARWLVQRTIWLVTTGETTWDVAGRCSGDDQRPVLTARGMHQARRAAATLATTPAASVLAADLRRTLQAARPVARALGVGVVPDQRLRARAWGTALGELRTRIPAELSGIVGDRVADADAAAPGGESVRALYRRATRFVADLLDDHLEGDVVLVADTDVVRVVLSWLAGDGPDRMPWEPVGHGVVIGRSVPVPAASPSSAG